MRHKRKEYSKEEIVYIGENYSELGAKPIADKLKRPVGSVQSMVFKLRKAGLVISYARQRQRTIFKEALKILTK